MARTKMYNRLDGPEAFFAIKHGLPTREYCVKVDKMRKRPVGGVEEVAGNGEFGFPRRRISEDAIQFVKTLDGEGLKKARKTICRHRKNVSRLATNFECSKDFELLERKNRIRAKIARRKNRNRKANWGRK